jgi:hypothetical protein
MLALEYSTGRYLEKEKKNILCSHDVRGRNVEFLHKVTTLPHSQ